MTREPGRAARELGPRRRALVRQVPESMLAVDREIQAGVHEIGHVGGRDDRVGVGADLASLGERPERQGHEVVLVPRSEERARADDERLGVGVEDAIFGLELRASVDAERRRRVVLVIGSLLAAVEHEVRREREQRDLVARARPGQRRGAERVLAQAALPILLGVVDAHVARGVDDEPGLVAIERRRHRVGVRDVELVAAGQPAREAALGAQLLERAAEGAGRAGDQDLAQAASCATRTRGVPAAWSPYRSRYWSKYRSQMRRAAAAAVPAFAAATIAPPNPPPVSRAP